jgi:dipeptidyl-peptidase 4
LAIRVIDVTAPSRGSSAAAFLVSWLCIGAAAAAGPDLAAYQRAEAVRADKIVHRARNLTVEPIWVGKGDRFWLREETAQGWRYVEVDPEHRTRSAAFDQVRLAATLSTLLNRTVDPDHLSLENLAVDGSHIVFEADGKHLACALPAATCSLVAVAEPDPMSVRSPDGKRSIFTQDDDLWVRDVSSGATRRLTHDGEPHFSYGKMPDSGLLTVLEKSSGKTFPPWGIQWSPDGRKLVVVRVDERRLPDYYFLQSVPYDDTLRPKPLTIRTALSAEPVKPSSEVSIIDVDTADRVVLNTGPDGLSPSLSWSADDSRFFAVQGGDYTRTETLFEIDARSGAMRTVLAEKSPTFLQISPLEYDEPALRYLARSNEFIWFSQRDGWNHLYLVDARTGAVETELGKGPWSVQNIVRVDETHRRLYFTAVGREPGQDPYFRHLYSVGLDGRGLRLLTPEAADHAFPSVPNPALRDALRALGFPTKTVELMSPTGRYFIDVASTIERPTLAVLRDHDGRLVMPLVGADISAAQALGWVTPEPFHAKAADGTTDLYGLVVRPFHFDPSRKYPVVECIYNGPQVVTTPHDFAGGMTSWMMSCAQSFAQLGFVTVVMDGRGTPMRSKAFQDYIYNNMQEFALEDHVAALKALAAERPYMDLARLGVIGHSFGGYTSMKAILGYPDFYKAAVSSAGPYDVYGMYPLDAFFEPPRFSSGTADHGPRLPDNWGNVDLTQQASRLKGKLLIAYGDLDENALPAVTARMINALIKANKEFDLIYLPNRSHAFSGEPYFIRRSWDFLVRSLMDAEPPKDYAFGSAP